MRRLLLGLVLLGSLVPAALAQLTATLTINTFTGEVGKYSFDIWARRTNEPTAIFVGQSSFYLSYNASALGAPSLTNINSRYTGDGVTANYSPMTVEIVAGKIAVTVRYTGAAGGSSALSSAAPDGERMCTVTLPITDPLQAANLVWDVTNSSLTTTGTAQIAQTFAGSDSAKLSIQLASFTATVQQDSGNVLLKWSTASETNNYGFEAQKALEGSDVYQTIANSFVAGNGTTVEPHSYRFADVMVTPGVWYYRLKQMNLDGAIRYSEAIRLTHTMGVEDHQLPTAFALDQNYPNPFNPSTTIEFALPKESQVRLEVYDVLGQLVATLVDDIRPAGYYAQRFDASALGTGIYFYRLSAGENSFLKKMLLVK
jgi:hypothetical protein